MVQPYSVVSPDGSPGVSGLEASSTAGGSTTHQRLYAMQSRGRAESVGENRSGIVSNAEHDNHVDCHSGCSDKRIAPATAQFTSEVHMTAETSFTKSGTITFGDGHSLRFYGSAASARDIWDWVPKTVSSSAPL
jgi:hypothetical protein